jgi:hypothetical protein
VKSGAGQFRNSSRQRYLKSRYFPIKGRIMTEINATSIEELIANATDLPLDRVDYVNNVRINVGLNEVTLDFFYVSPNPKNPQGEPQVKHSQRIILPVSVAKETGELLMSSMLRWEETFGVALPFSSQSEEIFLLEGKEE